MEGSARRPRRAVRLIAAAALLAAALGVLHAVAVAELLGKRRLVALACRHPDRFLFGWDSADSPAPGRVRVRGVWFRGRGRDDEWWFRIAEATFAFDLFELPARRFHVTSLTGSGFAFWYRRRRDPRAARPALAKVLPPIPGFDAVPLSTVPPWSPPPPGKTFWTVTVDRVVLAAVTDLWVDRARLRGSAGARGRFTLLPHAMAAVGPATLDVASGAVSLDRLPLADALSGRLAARIRPYDPALVADGRASFWDYAGGTLRVDAAAGDLAGIARLLPPSLALSGGRARLAARLAAAPGGAVRGSVALDAARVAFTLPRVRVAARVSVRADVRAWSPKTRDLALGPSRLELREAAVRGPESASGWWATLRVPALRAGPGDGVRGHPALACRDALPILGALAPGAPRFLRKLLAMPGVVAAARLRAGPRLLAVEALEAEGGGVRVRGRYERRAEARRGALLVEKGKVAVGVRIGEREARLKLLGARRWFARAEAERLPAAGR